MNDENRLSLAAKRSGAPLLAVATQEGSVYVWDTSKREELGRGQLTQSAILGQVFTTRSARAKPGRPRHSR
jgi:alpha-tubulin suppressor-like RCC1 family protein